MQALVCRIADGSDDSIEAMSARLAKLAAFVSRAGFVGILLAGRHPIALTPTRLLRQSNDLPHDWQEQRRFFRFAA
jgi:site-specific DNA recombinase